MPGCGGPRPSWDLWPGLLKVGDCLIVVALFGSEISSLRHRIRIVGSDFQGTIEIGRRLGKLAELLVSVCSIAVQLGVVRQAVEGLVVIADCFFHAADCGQ